MGGDMEGVGLRLRRPRRGHLGWAFLVILVAGMGFLSYRPVMRLKAELPPGFMDVRKEWSAERRAAEERTARAYWQLALNIVQGQHTYGAKLPEDPVPEFKIDEREFPAGSSAASPATRAKYWKRLREAWLLPQAWEPTHQWSLAWFPENIKRFATAVSEFLGRIWGQLNH